MNNNFDGGSRLCVPVFERGVNTEAAGDYTLPDYRSEIRRILRVTETVLPPVSYVNSDSVEFNGAVDYQVLYVGADGGIYSAPVSGEYSFSVPIDKGVLGDDSSALCALCDIYCEGVSARVSAPRRLSLRCRLRPLVRIYAQRDVSGDALLNADESVVTRMESCNSLVCESGVSDVIELGCTVAAPSEDTRVAAADGYVTVSSAECVSGGVFCRGKATLRLLCAVGGEDGEENYTAVTAEIPFEAEADVDVCSPDFSCRCEGILSSLTVEVTDAGIECSAEIMVKAVVFCDKEVSYIADAYSLTHASDAELSPLTVRRAQTCGNGNVTVSERVPIADTGIPDGAELITSYGRVCVDKCAVDNGKAVFSGNGIFTLVWRANGEIGASDVELPVRYERQVDNLDAPVSFVCRAEATELRASMERGELRLDAELTLGIDCVGETSVSPVSRLVTGEKLAPSSAELIVCYPDAADTLWSVAKRYAIPLDNIDGDPQCDKYVIIK